MRETRTKTQKVTKTETHWSSKDVVRTIWYPQLTYITKPVTIKSEILIPETTIVQTHSFTRTIHSDHYYTITPPTRTVVHTQTETHHKTTLTLPIQTEIITHYIPPSDRHVMMKYLGNTCIFAVAITLLFLYFAFLKKKNLKNGKKVNFVKDA